MASLAVSLFAAPAADAGTYFWTTKDASGNITAQSPAFTGGTAFGLTSNSHGPFNGSIPYSSGTGNSYGGGGSRMNSPSCSGAITATLTWQPDPTKASDPPPPSGSVIVMETSTASASAVVGTNATCSAKCDDGMGKSGSTQSVSGTPSYYDTSTPPQPTQYTAKVSTTDTRYTAQGGATITLNISPSSSANASAANGPAGWQTSASVSYTVSVSPITIIPNGAAQDSTTGAYSLLTGQQVSTGLTGMPFAPGTGSTYQWSGGGDTFYTYNEKAPSHQLVLLSDDPKYTTSPGFSFYDKSAETVTITCKASLVCPDGTSLTLNPSSQPITVKKPTLTASSIAEGYVQLASDGSAFGLYGNLNGTGNSTNGMIWSNFAVNVPAPFSGNGQCTFTQLVNPDHLEYVNGSSTPIGSNNGILGLDGSFEYGTPWNVTGTGNDVDSPNQPLFYRTGLTEISVSDAFTTYVMYQPSGGVWVPLDKFSWTYGMTLNWVPQTQQFSLAASYPSSAGQAGTPTPTTTTDPPQWTVVQASE